MINSLLDTAVVPIQKLDTMKPSKAMISTGEQKPVYFSYGGNVSPEVQLSEPPPVNLSLGGVPGSTVVPVSKTIEATTYSGDKVGEGISNLVDNNPILTPDPVLEREPKVLPFDMMMMEPQYPIERNIEPIKKMDPQLEMILNAQINKKGFMALLERDNDYYRKTL